MSVISVRIDDNKRKALKVLASIEGKSIGGIVTELIEKYIDEKKDVFVNFPESEHLKELMKLSESSFSEWNNEEDKVYDSL